MTSEKAFLKLNFQFLMNVHYQPNTVIQSINGNYQIAPTVSLLTKSRDPNTHYVTYEVVASGLTPGKYLIEATLTGAGQKLPKFESSVTAETMTLFTFTASQNYYNSYNEQIVTVNLFIHVDKNYEFRDCENIGCKGLQKVHAKVFDDSLFSDFKFIVKGKEFKVHRAILSAASPVFTKLFTVDMEEAKNNECDVDDIEPEVFEYLLRFIYKREMPEKFYAVAMKLFEAAHYYEIEELKEICLQKVFKILNTFNAVRIFNWACLYDCEELKGKAWIIVKRDILELDKTLKSEPPTPEMLQNILTLWEQMF